MTNKNKVIMICDDDPLMLRSVQKILLKAYDEFSIVTSSTGTACPDLVAANQPEIIILDVNMPDMDGFEVCKLIRANKATKHIPILMMTGERLESASKAAGLSIGADAYLFKPFGNAELIAQVQVMLRVKRAEDILRTQKESQERNLNERIIELQKENDALQQKVQLLEKQLKERTP